MKSNLLSLTLGFGMLFPMASARTWTSADGEKTFEGDLKSYDAGKGSVTVTLANGRQLTFMQDKLSELDISWLKKNGKRSTGGSSVKVGDLPKELPDPDGEDADMSKPVQVFIMMGQSNMLGFGTTSQLKSAAAEKYPYLVDDAGEWTTRKDVRNVRVMCSGAGPWKTHFNDWLSGSNGSGAGNGKFGPEIGIGYHLGHVIDAPVLLLKSCIGNRSLGWDLLPPSAEGTGLDGKSYGGDKDDPDRTPKAGDWYAGIQYDGDTRAMKEVLKDLGTCYPGAKEYEVAGIFWWQGAAEGAKGSIENYEQNLAHLFNDLKNDFNAPNAKFVCATLGQDSKSAPLSKQMFAFAKRPELKGSAATFFSNPVSKGGGANGHYGGNAETYMNVGVGMGQAMVELLKE